MTSRTQQSIIENTEVELQSNLRQQLDQLRKENEFLKQKLLGLDDILKDNERLKHENRKLTTENKQLNDQLQNKLVQ